MLNMHFNIQMCNIQIGIFVSRLQTIIWKKTVFFCGGYCINVIRKRANLIVFKRSRDSTYGSGLWIWIKKTKTFKKAMTKHSSQCEYCPWCSRQSCLILGAKVVNLSLRSPLFVMSSLYLLAVASLWQH